jgi:hypothetical protein
MVTEKELFVSPDVTHPDFSLWSSKKSKVYKKEV